MRKNCLKFFTLIIVLAIIFRFVPTASVYADDSSGIIVSPPYLVENIQSNVELVREFHVTNNLSQGYNFKVRSREIAIDQNKQLYAIEEDGQDVTSRFEEKGWVVITPNEFYLDKGERQVVTVTVNITEDIPTNGYYLELAVSVKYDSSDPNQISLIPEVGLPLAVNYKGYNEVIRKFNIIDFRQQGKPEKQGEVETEGNVFSKVSSFLAGFQSDHNIYEYHPVEFFTTIENIGNVHAIPTGQIFISHDPTFNTVEEVMQLNEEKRMVFAGTRKSFSNIWNDSFLELQEDGKLIYHWDKLGKIRIGKYYAQLNLIWEDDKGVSYLTRETGFWIIPWRQIALLILSLTIIIIVVRHARKKSKVKVMHDEKS